MANFVEMRAFLMPQPPSIPKEGIGEKSIFSKIAEKVSAFFERLFQCCGSKEDIVILSDIDSIILHPCKDRSANRTISINNLQVSSLRAKIQQQAITVGAGMSKPEFIAAMKDLYPNEDEMVIVQACSVITPGEEPL